MINIIYKEQKDLVLRNPKNTFFISESDKKKAIKEYKEIVKNFIDNLPEKYKSVTQLYEEIKDDDNLNLGLTCLLYINILENEEILENYYSNGLKHEDKENFIKYISKIICKKYFDDDQYYDEEYDEDLGFLKIYTSIHALKEYNNSKHIISKPNCIDDFYQPKQYNSTDIYRLHRFLIREILIFKNNETLHLFDNLINKYDLGIYEQIYLTKCLDEFCYILNDEIVLDENLIIPYINFVKSVKQKDSLYYLHELKNQTPVKFDELVNNGNLNYDEISELLMYVHPRLNLDRFKEITPNKVLRTFNTIGVHENYKLCKDFMHGYIIDKENKKVINADIFFDTKHLDILYSIKDRTKEEIELYIKTLNTITEKIDIDKLIHLKFFHEKTETRKGVVTVEDFIGDIRIGEHDEIGFEDYSYYEIDNYIEFLQKAKNYNEKYPQSSKENLGYHNITDFRQEYPWKLYQYINKINNFIINNNIIDNFQSFMELLDLNENEIELLLSNEIKQMLINEGYLKVEVSYQFKKSM